jgi:glyoxylase-like metal-dependent hydrolase (beta-lactamase superfamily II)
LVGLIVKIGAALRAILVLTALLAGGSVRASVLNMRVFRINDHLLSFYDGRPAEAAVKAGDTNWADFGANNVGVATYVIYRGDRALVYDTFPSVAQARWVRDYLVKAGIRHFVVVNSHWHLDHVGGNAVYADSDVIATEQTRQNLLANKAAIEGGTAWGPPAIAPLVIPDIGIVADTLVVVGDIKVELRPVQIHSQDGLVIFLPADRILLAGDTLEDTVTFISEPEHIPEQYRNLLAMKQWGFDRILPNHGNPDVIARGGYPTALIDVTRTYLRRMVEHAHDPDFTGQSLDSYIADPVRDGTVSVWWAYREAHHANLGKVAKAWKDRPLPDFGS